VRLHRVRQHHIYIFIAIDSDNHAFRACFDAVLQSRQPGAYVTQDVLAFIDLGQNPLDFWR
jgi:hypothetical protein